MLPSFINPLITLIYRQHVSAAPRGPLHSFQEEGLNLSCFLAILVWRNPWLPAAPSPFPAAPEVCRGGLPTSGAGESGELARGEGVLGAPGFLGSGLSPAPRLRQQL